MSWPPKRCVRCSEVLEPNRRAFCMPCSRAIDMLAELRGEEGYKIRIREGLKRLSTKNRARMGRENA